MQTSPDFLIVGAGGRVGRLLVPALRLLGAGLVLTRRGAGPLMSEMTELQWSPLDDPEALPGLLGAVRPAAMLVLAGTTPSTGQDMGLNVTLGQACLHAARTAGIGRVLLASSSAVYGVGREAPWHEDDAVDPPSAYGRAKLEMERTCAGSDVCALRIGNVAGADALLTNPARPLLLDRFPDGGTPERSYIGPQSLARVLRVLARSPALPPVLNIGAPRPVTMGALARAADLPVTLREAPPTATARLVLDCARLETLVPFAQNESTAPEMIAQWRACKEDR
ncbi:MAG: NAD-dependent epimerase/dehydratase family protein [Rhodobacteraceae bacterium]|nr:NAD-dependent epimerase/dehydratase family protein [Paracoccaceae bacterium]